MTSPTGSKKSSDWVAGLLGYWVNRRSHSVTRLHSHAVTQSLSHGLTLIEVLISVILLSGGAVLVIQSFATGWEAITRADERSAAYLFALSKLADIELANSQGRDISERADGGFQMGSKPFTWHVDVQTQRPEEGEARRVILCVRWSRGRDKDEALFGMVLPTVAASKKGA